MDDTAQLSLQFLRGSFILRKSDGDSRITVGGDGLTKTENLPVRLLSPDFHAHFVVPPTETVGNVKFAWARADGEKTQRDLPNLEVSSRSDFSRGHTQSFPLKDSSFQAQLAPGRYFWRVVFRARQ